ncbi:hypothetical protein [Paracoccus pacificus]|uniref:Tetratricopeptide repeat-containing protein n=1 Tax=Paracoccus pacificus TaxID=1463598 RepID=A0ABW4R673_9RHOB
MSTESILANARKNLISGDAEAALASLTQLSEHLEKTKFEPSQLPALRSELGRLHGLAEAAIEGHARAKETVTEILALAGILKTYDETGRETIHATSPRVTGKINHNF